MSNAVRDDDVAGTGAAHRVVTAPSTMAGLALLRGASGERPSALDRPGVASVYQAIRSAIVSGRLVPGQRLVEDEICRQFGARRHSARHALQQLSHEGMVVLRPNRGAQVRRLTPKDTRNVLELLVPVQTLAAGLAATRRRSADIRGLASLVEASAATGSVPEDLVAIDRAIDLRVAAASRNASVVETVDRLLGQLSLARPHPLLRRPCGETVADHQTLSKAVREGRGDQAERGVTRRLTRWIASFPAAQQ